MNGIAARDMRTWRWAVLLLIAAGIIGVANRLIDRDGPVAADLDAQLLTASPAFGPANYDAAMAKIERDVRFARERVAAMPDAWVTWEKLGDALRQRGLITGSYDDLAEAGKAIERGIALSPAGTGPVVSEAAYFISTHDPLKTAKPFRVIDGYAVPPMRPEAALIETLRADAAFYSGDYAAAQQHVASARSISDNAGAAYRQGLIARKLGDYDGARKAFGEAAGFRREMSPQFLCVMLLQSGVDRLVRGEWDEAKRFFARADEVFPGYWLAEAHLAQMHAVDGDYAKARQAYLAIVEEHPQPEIMEALAGIEKAMGHPAAAQQWADRAGEVWRHRLAVLPAAAYGHAVEYELILGDPQRARELAQRHYDARPFGESAIMLAETLVATKEPRKAIALLQRTERTGWHDAALYVTLAHAEEQLGDTRASRAAREKALALNPRSFDPASAFIRFGHH